MYNVLDFGADPTGVTDSGACFANAIEAAVTTGAGQNRMGDCVAVPGGLYRLDHPLHLYGNVLLEGVGTGVGTGGSRLQFGPGAGIIIHSSASSPYGPYAGGACVRGLDIYGTRPTFSDWAANTSFHIGQCIRNAGDNSAYYECVAASGMDPRSSTTRPPAQFSPPELSSLWKPGQYVTGGSVPTVRRSIDGDFGWYFVCHVGGITGLTEPAWVRSEGAITSEDSSPVQWIAHAPGSYLPVDGDLIWRTRFHTGVLMLAPGTVEHCFFNDFANAGISVIASHAGWPYTNANSWYVSHCLISNCGKGVYVLGPDANGGTCVGVQAIVIGYDSYPHSPMPWGILGDRSSSGGHAFHDLSMFGNTYIGCLAESTNGRSYCTAGENYHRSSFINCYAEENCYPGSVGRGAIVLGGTQFAGGPAVGFERHGEGLYLDPIYGVTNLKIRSHPDLPDVPLGALDQPGLHGFYTFTDNQQGQNYFGWSRGQNGFFPSGWAFGTMPYFPFGFFGVAGYDAPEGAHWRDFYGHWRGLNTLDQYYLAVSKALDDDPRWIAGGARAIGFRQEPPGGYVVDGTRYIGRMVTTAGYEGRPWEANATGYYSGIPASMIMPPTPNGFVYRCVRSGNSGDPPESWPNTPGAEFDEIGVETPAVPARWQCAGPVARYEYYGACVVAR